MQYNLLVTFVPAKKTVKVKVKVTFYFAAYSTGIRFCLLYYFRFLGTFIDLYMGHCTLLFVVVQAHRNMQVPKSEEEPAAVEWKRASFFQEGCTTPDLVLWATRKPYALPQPPIAVLRFFFQRTSLEFSFGGFGTEG